MHPQWLNILSKMIILLKRLSKIDSKLEYNPFYKAFD